MNPSPLALSSAFGIFALLAVVLAGVVVPVAALLMFADTPGSLALAAGPILALGLMGAGMIAAAAAGRLWAGIFLALANGACLLLLAHALGMAPMLHPLSTGFALIIASISFAARGALFARSALEKGWLIAVFVVAGEAAILITAAAMPGALPDWLLALLPAQWANVALQSTLTGAGAGAAGSVLLALAGTAAATLLVARLLPRRWPYLLMFTTWLALSALVYFQTAPAAAT